MKKTTLLFLALCTIMLLTVFSCKKATKEIKTTPGTYTPTSGSLNQLFSALRYVPQKLSVIAGRDTMIFGEKGTMLHFYKTSFRDASGNTLTSGRVDLELIEMYKPGDMISNRATTIAQGQLLKSGGQINITATMDGMPVYTNKYGLGFKQDVTPTDVMSLFNGGTNNADSIVNWDLDSLQKRVEAIDSMKADFISYKYKKEWDGYVFDSVIKIGYINCDYFYNNTSPKTSVSAILPDKTFNVTNTQMYLVLPEINCVMSTTGTRFGDASYDSATHVMKIVSESMTHVVPIGMKYKLIVIANKSGGPYYFFQESGIVTKDIKVDATAMTTKLLGDIQGILAAL